MIGRALAYFALGFVAVVLYASAAVFIAFAWLGMLVAVRSGVLPEAQGSPLAPEDGSRDRDARDHRPACPAPVPARS